MLTTTRRIANIAAGVLMLCLLAYYFSGFATAEARVKALCADVQPGMTLASLQEFADGHGLSPRPTGDGVRFLVEQRTFGRYGCRVVIKNRVVIESTYDQAS